MENFNINKKHKTEKEQLKLLKNHFKIFYEFNNKGNLKFPIYMTKKVYNYQKSRVETKSYYLNSYNDILREKTSFHSDIFISIFDKIPMYTDKKKAKNTVDNSRATSFFVIDFDTDYYLSKSAIEKFCFYLYTIKELDVPLPTSVVFSGSGVHFYFKFYKIDIYKNKNKAYFIKLYKQAIETVKNAYKKELPKFFKIVKPGYFTEKELIELSNLRIDEALSGSPSQLIRLPGTYNYEARETAIIIEQKENITYSLGELIIEYNPKYITMEPTENFKILPESKFNNKIIKINPTEYNEKSAIKLNDERLEDIKQLIKIRKETGTLKGTRQKIMSQTAWCLINNEFNGSKINVFNKLLEYGKLIGDEFSKENYVNNKIKHLNTYHKKRNKLSNQTICKFLEITNDELKNLPGLWITENYKRKAKQKEKIILKNKVYKDYKAGVKTEAIIEKYDISRRTVFRYIKEKETQCQGTILNRCNFDTKTKNDTKKYNTKTKPTNVEITNDTKQKIYDFWQRGFRQSEIAEKLGIAKRTVANYVKKFKKS